MSELLPAIEGFALGGGLIVAIGAQNAFVLRQGLIREYVSILCLIASISDAALIALGVFGFGTIVQSSETLLFAITVGGAIFLACYAILAARRAMTPSTLEAASAGAGSLKKAIAILLSFTFLNPHVYLDTVVLVGGISGQYEGAARMAFAIGAMSASFVWFFALGYGARLLAPLFAKPTAWRILDGLIAVVMAAISLSLFLRAFG